jgi:hypothetical protein
VDAVARRDEAYDIAALFQQKKNGDFVKARKHGNAFGTQGENDGATRQKACRLRHCNCNKLLKRIR